ELNQLSNSYDKLVDTLFIESTKQIEDKIFNLPIDKDIIYYRNEDDGEFYHNVIDEKDADMEYKRLSEQYSHVFLQPKEYIINSITINPNQDSFFNVDVRFDNENIRCIFDTGAQVCTL